MPAGCPDDHPHSYGREGHDSCAQWQHKQAGSSDQTMSSCSAEQSMQQRHARRARICWEGMICARQGWPKLHYWGRFMMVHERSPVRSHGDEPSKQWFLR